MARKRRKHDRKRRRPRAEFPARYALGTAVRVKRGTTDPDYPDIPLGGWSGTVAEVDRRVNPPTYLVEWSEHTLESMHPVFRRRCERDGLDWNSMWLRESDLEPDPGEPVELDQPTAIITRPLDPRDQDDRLRAILGATSDDPVPPVSEESLRRYHDYLAGQFSFPFPAVLSVESRPFEAEKYPVIVQGLLDVAEGDEEEEGLWCEVEQGGQRGEVALADLSVTSGRNHQLHEDYDYWFGNFPADFEGGDPGPDEGDEDWDSPSSGPRSTGGVVLQVGFYGGYFGAALGLLLPTSGWTQMGAFLGALLGGILLSLIGGGFGYPVGPANRHTNIRSFSRLMGAVLGAACGGLAGAVVGAVVPAWRGALVGFLIGAVGGPILVRFLKGSMHWVLGGVLGAAVGTAVLTMARHPHEAGAGILGGIPAGAAGAIALQLLMTRMIRRIMEHF